MAQKRLQWRDAKEREAYFTQWPEAVRKKFNNWLRPVMQGFKPVPVNTCKPWKGISGCHELSSGSYRLIFVWHLPEFIYVLYAFGGKTRTKHAAKVDQRWAELQAELSAAAGVKRH